MSSRAYDKNMTVYHTCITYEMTCQYTARVYLTKWHVSILRVYTLQSDFYTTWNTST